MSAANASLVKFGPSTQAVDAQARLAVDAAVAAERRVPSQARHRVGRRRRVFLGRADLTGRLRARARLGGGEARLHIEERRRARRDRLYLPRPRRSRDGTVRISAAPAGEDGVGEVERGGRRGDGAERAVGVGEDRLVARGVVGPRGAPDVRRLRHVERFLRAARATHAPPPPSRSDAAAGFRLGLAPSAASVPEELAVDLALRLVERVPVRPVALGQRVPARRVVSASTRVPVRRPRDLLTACAFATESMPWSWGTLRWPPRGVSGAGRPSPPPCPWPGPRARSARPRSRRRSRSGPECPGHVPWAGRRNSRSGPACGP